MTLQQLAEYARSIELHAERNSSDWEQLPLASPDNVGKIPADLLLHLTSEP